MKLLNITQKKPLTASERLLIILKINVTLS